MPPSYLALRGPGQIARWPGFYYLAGRLPMLVEAFHFNSVRAKITASGIIGRIVSNKHDRVF
jgi:hypothetical protein